jgi:hypothetical protein
MIPTADSEFEHEGENISGQVNSPKVCGSGSFITPQFHLTLSIA